MITNTREGEEFSADKLDNINNDNNGGSSSIITIKLPADSTTTSSSAWLRSKDPRIVRVSRAFGGKDRHSKVCTIRGLRDRRVRLSVPTAIQLYDLQDRLGLNQPSKVVDWLLNVAKDDIDELPPLQIPPGFNFIDQAHQAMLSSSSSHHAANYQQLGSTSQGEPAGSKINNASWEEDAAAPSSIGLHKSSSFWTNSQSTSTKFKHVVVGAKEVEKEMWTKGMQEDDHKLQTLELSHGGGGGGRGMQQVAGSSSNNYFPRSSNNHSSLPNFLHSAVSSPYAAASYYHFDYPSSFSLSSSMSSQAEDQHHNSYNVVPLLQSTTSLSLPSQSNYFLSQHVSSNAAPMELDPRQFINHFQILSPSQQQNSLHMSLDDVNKKR